jgi:hypothetical protein
MASFRHAPAPEAADVDGNVVAQGALVAALERAGVACGQPVATTDMPGPTGESNRLSPFPRGRFSVSDRVPVL